MTEYLGLNGRSMVIEVASNDGYLLQHFVQHGIPCLGIEPAANVADAARKISVPTEVAFLTYNTARRLAFEGRQADLLIANNVIAHVPDLNDFIAGLALLLKPGGVLSIECPHLLQLIRNRAFDTIYHEHFSYFSLLAMETALIRHGLCVYAAEELPTHGGSLRILACHATATPHTRPSALDRIRKDEHNAQLDSLAGYNSFAECVSTIRQQLNAFLMQQKQQGLSIAAYGAAAKGNTLLNVCGITTRQIDFAVDRNPAKQGRFLPGSRIPIHAPDRVFQSRPDILLILPWNIAAEIREQMQDIRKWGGKFATAIPELKLWV